MVINQRLLQDYPGTTCTGSRILNRRLDLHKFTLPWAETGGCDHDPVSWEPCGEPCATIVTIDSGRGINDFGVTARIARWWLQHARGCGEFRGISCRLTQICPIDSVVGGSPGTPFRPYIFSVPPFSTWMPLT